MSESDDDTCRHRQSSFPPARARSRSPVSPDASSPTPSHSDGPGDYEVGYGKPPKHSRFAPGVSGNRRGRPKGSRSISTLIAEGLDKSITAKIGRRTVTMKRREALAHRLIEQALGGDHRAVLLLMKLDPQAAPDTASVNDQGLPPEEAEMFANFLRRARGEPSEGGE